MKTNISIDTREFTPAEVAAITGVSVSLQRDWRRREILPERKKEGWTRFTLTDVIEIRVLKFFADAGFSVKDVREYSSMAVLPVWVLLKDIPGAVVFEGDPIGEQLQERILLSMEKDAGAAAGKRYFVIAHGANIPMDDRSGRFSTLRDVEAWLEQKLFEGFTAIDFEAIAAAISHASGEPLIYVKCKSE